MGTIVTPGKADIYIEDIVFRSGVSEELLRKLAASVNAINAGALRSLGTTEMAFLPLAQFQLLNDNSWALMSGQDITTTDYGKFLLAQGLAVGSVILPDMRGMAPVGINNGRADGRQHIQSPGLGSFIEGQVKSHQHSMNTLIGSGSSGAGNPVQTLSPTMLSAQWSSTQLTAQNAWLTQNAGQAQNTVNSVGVNWFIKVWNTAQP